MLVFANDTRSLSLSRSLSCSPKNVANFGEKAVFAHFSKLKRFHKLISPRWDSIYLQTHIYIFLLCTKARSFVRSVARSFVFVLSSSVVLSLCHPHSVWHMPQHISNNNIQQQPNIKRRMKIWMKKKAPEPTDATDGNGKNHGTDYIYAVRW